MRALKTRASGSESGEPKTAAVGLLSDDEANTELRQDPVPKWSAPENPGVGVALGHLRMDLGDESKQLAAQLTHPYPIVRGYAKRALDAIEGAPVPIDIDAEDSQIAEQTKRWSSH